MPKNALIFIKKLKFLRALPPTVGSLAPRYYPLVVFSLNLLQFIIAD